MNVRALLLSAAIVASWGAVGLGSSRAASYETDITSDPASFNCGYFVTTEICGGAELLTTPVNLAIGDTYNIDVTYTRPLTVPGSMTSDVIYAEVFNQNILGGPAIPGPDSSTNATTLSNYVGPAGYFSTYTSAGYLNAYIAAAGFCCGLPANAGFSLTGSQSSLLINTLDPDPMVGVAWGYSVALPATPAVLSGFDGGTPGHPVLLPAGEIGQISDAIGSGGEDFYQFNWTGGDFQTQATVTGADPSDVLTFELLDPYTHALIGSPVTLDSADDFMALLSDPSLAIGAYDVGIMDLEGPDPMFTITFDTPISPPFGVPEPASWTLMLAGLGALGAALRANRRRRHLAGALA
jgi:hypothetical protein